jgi:MFS family permease
MAAAGGPRAGTSWPVILAGRRGGLLIGMTLTELVVAVQILIVVTVLPAVVRQLGGIRLYGLALSVAAIAGIGAAPLAVRLLDRSGARVVVPAGALVFTCGALGAGLADRMTVLVAARFFEGAGAAALGAIAVSGIAALYEEPQRPKVMVLGFGMGLAYTGAWLAAMAAGQTGGGGATKLAGPLVADRMGTALGAGVGGVGIAVATRAGLGVGTGIGIGLAVAAAGACAIAVAAHRMA